jgi:hypothetical protein
VVGELSLPVVLRQIVGAARDRLGARYAALGVLGPDGGLEQFVHAGMDEELVARIGDLHTGRGILGLLISEPVRSGLLISPLIPRRRGSRRDIRR